MKKRIIQIIVAGAFTVAPLSMFAQPNPGGGSGGDPVGGDPIGGGTAPIGGGIALLVTMAIGYGIKRVFDARHKFE